jgi:CRP/FNR family transcriptional regulator
MIALTFPRGTFMKASTTQGEPLVQLDPSAFLADPQLIHALDARSTPVPCESDHVLFRQGEPAAGLYILHEGVATVSMISPDGHSLFAVQARPGSLLGLPGLVSGQPYSLSATAGAGSRVSFVSRNDFTAVMHTDPLLSLKILQVLAAEVRSARKALY